MFRVPLWLPTVQDSHKVGTCRAERIPVLDLHELTAGKLVALLARRASRDLFDAHHLLSRCTFDEGRLRATFVLYGAMNRKDWRNVSVDDVSLEPNELKNRLPPTLRNAYADQIGGPETWARCLVDECRDALSRVLPLSEPEKEFLNRLLDHGGIEPSAPSGDEAWVDRIKRHPLLEWKALNVRQHKGP